MQRRDFLRYSALGGVALSASGLLAYAMAGRHAPHGGGAPGLLSPEALPDGQPLRALPRIANLAEAPGHFRSALTPGPAEVPLDEAQAARLWLYNGKLAPLIEVTEGDDFDITLINELAASTSLHWHGVAVPHAQDGGPWHAVAPGASRRYRYRFPEGSAGLHWFHPHPHQGTAEQIAHGLAGALLVRPREPQLPEGIEEHLLLVSDLRLDSEARVAAHHPVDWMNGREGELLLVNGQRRPRLQVAPGTTLRLRLINACAGRYLRLRLEGHELTLIGTDGGLIERPRPLEELLLTPGERADLLVRIQESAGEHFLLASHPYERGWMGPRPAHLEAVAPLLELVTDEAPPRPALALPATLTSIAPLGEPAVRREVTLTEVMHGEDDGDHDGGHGAMHGGGHSDHGGGHNGGHGDHGAMPGGGHGDHAMPAMGEGARPPVDFLINGRAFAMDEVLFEGRVGQVEEWELFNDSPMDHPFHVHGTHFQVLARRDAEDDWRPMPWLAWKDTVNLAPYQRLRIRLVFREPGDWLFHCHIIEHEALGMMATIRIR